MKKLMSIFAACAVIASLSGCNKSSKPKEEKKHYIKKEKKHVVKKQHDKRGCVTGCDKKAKHVVKKHKI